MKLINPKWRERATSTVVVCFCAVIVIVVGGVAVRCIVKLCKRMEQKEKERKQRETNETSVVTFPLPQPYLRTDVTPEFRVYSTNAIPFVLAVQESPDLTNWTTTHYMTGMIDGFNVPLTLLDAGSNVLRVENVPLMPEIKPREPIVRPGTNQNFYRLLSIE